MPPTSPSRSLISPVQSGPELEPQPTQVLGGAAPDALYVAFVFNLVNRLANVFGSSWDTEEERSLLCWALHRSGYRVPGFLLR